jgi:hypothetical protein
LAVTLVPIGTFVVFVGLAWTWKLMGRRQSASNRSIARVMGFFMVAILLVLPTISRRISQTFRCKMYDAEHKFLEMDLEVCRVGSRVRFRYRGYVKSQ